MKIEEQKEVVKKDIVTVGYKCDVCGTIEKTKSFPIDWHEFSSNHHEWGNDSCDSYESYHVCSAKCYIDKFTSIVDGDYKNRYSAEVDEYNIQFARKLVNYFKDIKKNV